MGEKYSEGSCTKAALQSRCLWGNGVVRLYIARETKNQVSSWVNEFTAPSGGAERAPRSVVLDCVKDLVRWGLVIGLPNIEPKAAKSEGLCVVLVG